MSFIHPRHLQNLRASGLNDTTIEAHGIYSERDPEVIRKYLHCWESEAKQFGHCLIFPFVDGDGKTTEYVRLKPLKPRRDKRGKNKLVKYESPRKSPNRVFFPIGTRAILKNPSQLLVVTEGEKKKSLKADQEGFPCLGLVGVYGWCKKRIPNPKTGKKSDFELINDMAAIAWAGTKLTNSKSGSENTDAYRRCYRGGHDPAGETNRGKQMADTSDKLTDVRLDELVVLYEQANGDLDDKFADELSALSELRQLRANEKKRRMTSNEPVNLNLVDKVWADLAGDQGYTKIKYDAWERNFHIAEERLQRHATICGRIWIDAGESGKDQTWPDCRRK